jgi:DNA adenine methylase
MSKIERSPLFYVGDKYKLMKEIKTHFPHDINRFIEPFSGGGSVFLNVKANEYLVNDINQYVVELHKFLKNYSKKPHVFFNEIENIIDEYGFSKSFIIDLIPYDLKENFKKTYYAKFNKLAFEKLKQDYNNGIRNDFFSFYVLLIYGFNRMIRFNSSGKYNLPVGNVDFNSNVYNALNSYFEIIKNYNIKFYNKDYLVFLNKIRFSQSDDFVYFDPPYLITFSEYNKLWSEDNEYDLLKYLDKLESKGIKFAISNVTHYKDRENNIFLDWSKKYKTIPIKSNYISYHDNSIKKFNEVLVINY